MKTTDFLMTAIVAGLAVTVGGCAGTSEGTASFASRYAGTVSTENNDGSLRKQPSLRTQPNTEVGVETLVGAGATAMFGHPVNAVGLPGKIFSPLNAAVLYIVYDPLAPNWTVQERQFDQDLFHLEMRAKSFRTGGDGEAFQILKRRAALLQREKGYASYKVLSYSEGIESSTPLTHRVAEGTYQLVRVLPAEGAK